MSSAFSRSSLRAHPSFVNDDDVCSESDTQQQILGHPIDDR